MSILSSVPTGMVIKNYLEEYNISQKELSARTGVSEKHLSRVLNGKSRLTEELALKLEKIIPAVPASYWLNYEAKYREALAREKASMIQYSQEEQKKISKRFRFKEVFKGNNWSFSKQASEMLKLLKISDFSNFEKTYKNLAVSFMEDGGELEAIAIWLSLCHERAELQEDEITEDFNPVVLKEKLPELKAIAEERNADLSIMHAQKWLSKMGVYLIVHDAITNCKVRGALTTHKGKPAIFLNLRFKTHDHAWFALMHEIGHLLLHAYKAGPIISYEGDSPEVRKESEDEANVFAREFFLKDEEYFDFITSEIVTKKAIVFFAQSQKVHPGIVVSRLQHDGLLPYHTLNMLKSRFSNDFKG